MNCKYIMYIIVVLSIVILLTACTSPFENQKPCISVNKENYDVKVGEELVVPIKIDDPDGDVLVVCVTPEEMAQYYDRSSNIFKWIPEETGEREVVFSVSDGENTVKKKLTLNISKNIPPEVTVTGNIMYNAGDKVEITVNATDPDNDNLTYTVEGQLADYFEPEIKKLSWKTRPEDTGCYEIIFIVSDGFNESRKKVDLLIEPEKNTAPYFTSIGGEKVIEGKDICFFTEEGKQINFSVKADDDNDDLLTYRASGDLANYFDSQSHLFTWIPEEGNYGNYETEFIVDDGKETARIIVNINVNAKPVLCNIDDIIVNEGETVSFKVSAVDKEDSDDELDFDASGDLKEYFDSRSKLFNWDTTEKHSGVYDITFTVRDTFGSTDSETVEITVNNTPEIQFVEGEDLSNPYSINNEIFFILEAIDIDNSNLIIEMVDWYTYEGGSKINMDNDNHFVFNPNDNRGIFSWVPIAGDEGDYTITFKVIDPYGASNLKSIVLSVQ